MEAEMSGMLLRAEAPIVIARPESRIPRRRVVLFATSAVAFAFALVLMPGPPRHVGEIGIAAALALAVVHGERRPEE